MNDQTSNPNTSNKLLIELRGSDLYGYDGDDKKFEEQ